MSLFKKKSCCSCGSEQSICCEAVGAVTSVKVLGAGCSSCHKQYENVKEAVAALGLSVEVAYITDMVKIMEYGVMRMPAIVVNEKVVSAGRVLNATDVKKLLDASL